MRTIIFLFDLVLMLSVVGLVCFGYIQGRRKKDE